MTKQRLPTSDWYTETRRVYHNPPIKYEYTNGVVDKIYYTREPSNNNTLFSKCRYPTKFKKEDLPVWYLNCNLYHHNGWINMFNITDIKYIPNTWNNHLFKDDFLYIKFGGKIELDYSRMLLNYDIVLWGFNIVDFCAKLEILKKYINKFDKNMTSNIESLPNIYEQLLEKVELFKRNYPNEHEVMCVEEFKAWYDGCLKRYDDEIVA